MENRSRTYLALDHLTNNAGAGSEAELIQSVEVIPFDDKEYQLQLRLTTQLTDEQGAVPTEDIDREKVMDAVSRIRVDERLGVDDEIVYTVQGLLLNNQLYSLQVVMTSTRMIEGDKLWSV